MSTLSASPRFFCDLELIADPDAQVQGVNSHSSRPCVGPAARQRIESAIALAHARDIYGWDFIEFVSTQSRVDVSTVEAVVGGSEKRRNEKEAQRLRKQSDAISGGAVCRRRIASPFDF